MCLQFACMHIGGRVSGEGIFTRLQPYHYVVVLYMLYGTVTGSTRICSLVRGLAILTFLHVSRFRLVGFCLLPRMLLYLLPV